MTANDPAPVGIEHEDYVKPEDHHRKIQGRRANDRKGKKRLLAGERR